ncbi:Microtubule binding protein HOOK3 [Penicillium citrinum]|uniref:Microtubule binding protein HOOK3 n=1 Tax=Penicillium citrinum TaxID=5077 RepID=A0A9W9TFW7_PENCI|nr:Microtubule binding protein HOOK3 [Penicillium citrinum]KAJ5220894.1 Microtubule binding protein HOOK3 [Penicillium citrinum]
MASEHAVTQALLEWINSFSLGKTLRATEDLTDGVIIWEILQDIDPQYFLDEIPEREPGDHWVSKWQNLKHIYKLLTNYIRHQNNDTIPPGLDPSPDLEAIAEKASTKETNKLLKILLIAAIYSPNAATYVQTLQELSTPTQEALKEIIQEAQDGEHEPLDGADELREEIAKADNPGDLELKFEERVGKVLAENDRLTHDKKELQKDLGDMHNRLARLQENNDTLQNRLASTEDRLVTLKSGKGDLGFNAKALESKTRQQDDLIASQEAKLSAAQDEIDSLLMTVESLKVKNQRYQKLQDDYDELRTDRDQLARKANAAEKYRQKLQASQDFEKENSTLKNQIKDLQQQLKESDSQQRWTSERDVELEELRNLLPRIEQECNEIQNLKKQLEFNNHALTERLESADEQHERDDALISELRERLGELEGLPGTSSPGSDTPKMQGTLQKDFEAIGEREAQLKSENDDLKRDLEASKPPSTGVSGLSVPLFVILVLLIIFQPEGFSESFNASVQLARTNTTQSDDYWKLYETYTGNLKRIAEIQDALDTTKKDLSDAQTQIGLLDHEKADMLRELEEHNSDELAKLRGEWSNLSQNIHHLEAEVEASQTLVREVCAEREDLRKMLENKQNEISAEDQEVMTEMQMLLGEFETHNSEGGETPQKSSFELLKQCAGVLEKNIERLAQRAEYIQQQNELIKSLRERMKNYEENLDDGIPKEREIELQRIIDDQARELSLVSSAWYHLQSRWQNNNMTVSRFRHGANTADLRGWLAKQRSVVAGQ